MSYVGGAYLVSTRVGDRDGNAAGEDEVSIGSGQSSVVSSLIGLDVSSLTVSGSMAYSEDEASLHLSIKSKNADESSLPFDCQSSKSEESSLFLADCYFQEPLAMPGPVLAQDPLNSSSFLDTDEATVVMTTKKNPARIGRSLLRPTRRRRSKPQDPSKRNRFRPPGLVTRAWRSFRSGKKDKPNARDEVQSLPTCPSDAFLRLSPTSSKGTWSLSLQPTDEIEDAVSEISDAVEVWTLDSFSPTSEDQTVADLLTSPLPASLTRNLEDDFDDGTPNGLRSRAPMEEVIWKLKLGLEGWSALKSLEDAASATKVAFDPCKPCVSPTFMPTMRVSGIDLPDYDTHVREAVNSFRKDVLHISDKTYLSLQDCLGLGCTPVAQPP